MAREDRSTINNADNTPSRISQRFGSDTAPMLRLISRYDYSLGHVGSCKKMWLGTPKLQCGDKFGLFLFFGRRPIYVDRQLIATLG